MLNSPISLNEASGSNLTQPTDITDDPESNFFHELLEKLAGPDDPELTHPDPVESAGVVQTRGRRKRRFRAEHRNQVSKLPPNVFTERIEYGKTLPATPH